MNLCLTKRAFSFTRYPSCPDLACLPVLLFLLCEVGARFLSASRQAPALREITEEIGYGIDERILLSGYSINTTRSYVLPPSPGYESPEWAGNLNEKEMTTNPIFCVAAHAIWPNNGLDIDGLTRSGQATCDELQTQMNSNDRRHELAPEPGTRLYTAALPSEHKQEVKGRGTSAFARLGTQYAPFINHLFGDGSRAKHPQLPMIRLTETLSTRFPYISMRISCIGLPFVS
ncbi:uncharacterized protein BDZ83DRAFT_243821 [Colletotrichum acutatum]|uniref:Uncharacterized protein n=1 Tax=Glomerella acutata TaxID=27357 RepID=A0AAD8XPQ2_GLOAC|nr:uncharacterized protein BDZ83DRAFT_243821 [Colletotrichum acutatum]KAK1731254.1 hypothetical protein BDZ83DRAFT_243821 [Colletotrichum acutatum]